MSGEPAPAVFHAHLAAVTGDAERLREIWEPDGLVEIHGSATLLDGGGAYEQDYVIRMHETPAGRLDYWREVWDPTRF